MFAERSSTRSFGTVPSAGSASTAMSSKYVLRAGMTGFSTLPSSSLENRVARAPGLTFGWGSGTVTGPVSADGRRRKDDLLHRERGRDPWAAAGFIARTVVDPEGEPEAARLGRRVVEELPPVVADVGDDLRQRAVVDVARPRRDGVGQVAYRRAAKARRLQFLQVAGDACRRDVAAHPEPVHEWARHVGRMVEGVVDPVRASHAAQGGQQHGDEGRPPPEEAKKASKRTCTEIRIHGVTRQVGPRSVDAASSVLLVLYGSSFNFRLRNSMW